MAFEQGLHQAPENCKKIDFLWLLNLYKLNKVTKSILSYLEAKDITSCEGVSKRWRWTLVHNEAWKTILQRKLTTDPVWRDVMEKRERMIYMSNSYSKDAEWNNFLYKRIYGRTASDIKNLASNWENQNFYTMKITSVDSPVSTLKCNSRIIAIACADGTVRSYDKKTFMQEESLLNHEGAVTFLQLNDDFLISGSIFGIVHILNLASKRLMEFRNPYASVNLIDIKLTGNSFVLCYENNIIQRHDIESSSVTTLKWTYQCNSPVYCLQYNGRFTLCGTKNGDIINVTPSRCYQFPKMHEECVRSMAIYKNSMVSVGLDKIVIWKLAEMRALRVLVDSAGNYLKDIQSVHLSEKRLVFLAHSGIGTLWNMGSSFDEPHTFNVRNLNLEEPIMLLEMDAYSIIYVTFKSTLVMYDYGRNVDSET